MGSQCELKYPCDSNILSSMTEGRLQLHGQVIPIATAVTDAAYCFKKYENKQSTGEGPKLLCAGREKCKPNYHVARSDFSCNLIEFVCMGRGRLNLLGESHALTAGHIFSYGMTSAHDLWSDADEPMTKYFAAYLWDSEAGGSSENTLLPGMIRWSRDIAVLRTLFDELIKEGQQSGKMHEEITARYLELILLKGGEALLPEAARGNGGSDSFDRVMGLIDGSFSEIDSLEELGKLCGLQPNYICRLFRKFSQETPNQCLTRLKLNRAAELLLAHSTSVSEIARQVGYADPFYFSRVFKQRFGCSPKDFRESPIQGKKSS